jgi:N6-L-threonylcarbamoyladenine synthase
MIILGFESSCDETSAAVVEIDDTDIEVRSNIVASQISTHALYGGVVPEIASRAHTEAISRITYEALEQAHCTMQEIDAVAVTAHPGLIGALLVGVSFAKSLAAAYDKPLIAVNHILGHIAANYIAYPDLKPPFLAFVASGGHTSIISMKTHIDAETVGRTRDDAIGEAFDKVARVMGMPYPGGAQMDALAKLGDVQAIRFPSAAIAGENADFSFSGLKTAVMNYLHHAEQLGEAVSKEDVAASFTKTVCTSVTQKLETAMRMTGNDTLVVAGGVAANSHLRQALTEFAQKNKVKLYLPPLSYCGDNAAMIATQAYWEFQAGKTAKSDLNAAPSSHQDSVIS